LNLKSKIIKGDVVKVLVIIASLVISSFSFANEAEHAPLFPQPQPNATVTMTPEKPSIVEPAFFAAHPSDTIILKWKASNTATHYHVQVAKDANFKWLILDNATVAKTEVEVSKLEKNKHYYWRVAAVNSKNDPSYTKSVFAASMFETK
jgi:hypothetical protein